MTLFSSSSLIVTGEYLSSMGSRLVPVANREEKLPAWKQLELSVPRDVSVVILILKSALTFYRKLSNFGTQDHICLNLFPLRGDACPCRRCWLTQRCLVAHLLVSNDLWKPKPCTICGRQCSRRNQRCCDQSHSGDTVSSQSQHSTT